MLARTKEYLNKLGYTWYEYVHRHNKTHAIQVTGGRTEVWRFLSEMRPPRLLKAWSENGYWNGGELLACEFIEVKRVLPIGRRKVARISTDVGTYIAEGFGAHNTGSWYWNGAKYLGTVTPGGWEHDFPLIEAEYLTLPLRYPRVWRFGEEPMEKEPQVLGRGWSDWWMWQWTSKMEPIGVSSKSQDAIVFNGSYQDLRRELGIGTPQPTLEEKVEQAHPELH